MDVMTLHPSGRRRRLTALLVAAGLAVLTAACGTEGETTGGTSSGGGGGGSIPASALKGATLTVGSKEFTEQKILGEITIQALKAAGASVKDQTGLAGSVAARKALTSGNIDMYWEYTGTGWLTYLQHTKPVPGSQAQYQAVAKEDEAKNGIRWIDLAPANNTYAFAVKAASYDKLGVKKISDFKTLIAQNPDQASLCVGEEFTARDDGLPGVEKTYGIKFPKVTKIDEGLIYEETKKGADGGGKCNFGEVFITDGRIKANNLKVIQDDKRFFPQYNLSLTVPDDVLKRYPKIETVFKPIAAKLDNATMQSLNAQVDVDGLTEDAVAEEWLSKQGFTG
jgi:osmoprotectant transport system substrate-binding protein